MTIDDNGPEPFISLRDHIHWIKESDPSPTEPTSTLVLTTRERRFVDIRINKPKAGEPDLPNEGGPLSRLQWAFAGTSHTSLPPDAPPHCVWTHWIDSLAPPYRDSDVRDEGDMLPQADGRSLETGAMVNPATERLERYEELWSDGTVDVVGGEERRRAVALELRERDEEGREWARGMVVRVGQWVQGIIKVVSTHGDGRDVVEVSCERWECRDGAFERRVKIGRLWLPCSVAVQPVLEIGKEVRHGDFKWEVVEVDEW